MKNPNYNKPYWAWYRLDKNISWHNLITWPLNIIYGFITLEWLKPNQKYIIRLKPWKIWMPPIDKNKRNNILKNLNSKKN